MELGDFNEDGVLDALVASVSPNPSVTMMIGRPGPGSYWFDALPSVPVGGSNPGLVTGDFDNDTHLDAAVVSFSTNNVTILRGDGTGALTVHATIGGLNQPFDVAAGYFNADANLDLVTANQNGDSVSILLGDGTGGFSLDSTYTVGDLPRGVAVGDVTGDGNADLVVANTDGNTITLLAGDGAGGFAAPPAPYLTTYLTARGPRKVALGDFNEDGLLDIATADSGDNSSGNPALRDNRTTVLLNNGSGPSGGLAPAAGSPFTTGAAASSPFAIRAHDVDGDGHLDLVTANRYGASLSVLQGAGDGTFAAPVTAPYADTTDAVVTDVAVGDINEDGKPDLIGNVLQSAPGFLVVFENTTTIDPPTVLATTPSSLGNTGTPTVSGTTDGGTVTLYTTSDCSGAPNATGTAAQFEGAGITASVPPDQTRTFYATTTNAAGWATSSCSSTSVTYTYDATPPDAPTGLASAPASPANDNNPTLSGAAEAGSTVRLYTSANCTGPIAAQGTAAAFSSPGFTVAVADDSSTTFTATATDAAGNISACSSAVVYAEDSTPPSAPTIFSSSPSSPSFNTSPKLLGFAEAGSTISIYASSDCSGSPAAIGSISVFSTTGLTVTVADHGSTTFTATSTDAAGNTSACSSGFTYTSCSSGVVVTSTADAGAGSLREAIANACGTAVITFNIAGAGPHTLTLTSGELTVDKNLAIAGPSDESIRISGNDSSRVFDVEAGASLSLFNLTIQNGRALDDGGGIRNRGTLTVTNSTLSENSAAFFGGAIHNEAVATINNSTISGNSATSAGGIHSTNTLTLVNTTITANTASVDWDGLVNFGTGTARNSIVAGNTGSGSDGGSTLTDLGNNLLAGDPRLAPLANNGGPTFTHAPLAGSPALDAGDNAAATAAGLTFDQRVFMRVADGPDANTTDTVDIGAVEALASLPLLADQVIAEDGSLSVLFDVGDGDLLTSVTPSSSDTTLVPNVPGNVSVTGSGATRSLSVVPVPNEFGSTLVTVAVTANLSFGVQTMTETLLVTVNPVGDAPAVTDATTRANMQTTSGLVITPNAADGAEVTHFRITNIANGTLFKTDGMTPIADGGFITVADGSTGLKFTPTTGSIATGSFTVQAGTDDAGAGLGAASVATITIVKHDTTTSFISDAPDASEQHEEVRVVFDALSTTDGPTPTGTVTVTVSDGPETCTGPLDGTGRGECLITLTEVGVMRTLTATYNGDASSNASAVNDTERHMVTACPVNPLVTTNADDGPGSLRQALLDACPNSTLDLGGVASPIGLTSGTLTLAKNVTIVGPGAGLLTIERTSGEFGIFKVNFERRVTIEGVTIANGAAPGAEAGGGIDNVGGTLTLRNSEIVGSSAWHGGAIFTGQFGSSAASTTIVNSTLRGNSANGKGGAIFHNGGFVASSTLTIVNSTISGNTARNDGGGIASATTGTSGLSPLTILSSTIANNVGATGILGATGGGLYADSDPVVMVNTIVAGNLGVFREDVAAVLDTAASFNNLIGVDTNMSGVTHGSNGNLVGVADSPIDPRLAALALNGGTTWTHAPLPGSPAIDAGDNAWVTSPPFPAGAPIADQRGTGFARILDAVDADAIATVDIGAVEANPSIEDITDKTTVEETPLSFTFAVDAVVPAFDAIAATSSDAALVPDGNLIVSGSGASRTLTVTPAPNRFGATEITVTATKTIGGSAVSVSDTFTLTVSGVNDAPTLNPIANPAAILEDAGQQTIGLSGITPGPGSETGTLTVTATSDNTGLIPHPALSYSSPAASGSLSYAPIANAQRVRRDHRHRDRRGRWSGQRVADVHSDRDAGRGHAVGDLDGHGTQHAVHDGTGDRAERGGRRRGDPRQDHRHQRRCLVPGQRHDADRERRIHHDRAGERRAALHAGARLIGDGPLRRAGVAVGVRCRPRRRHGDGRHRRATGRTGHHRDCAGRRDVKRRVYAAGIERRPGDHELRVLGQRRRELDAARARRHDIAARHHEPLEWRDLSGPRARGEHFRRRRGIGSDERLADVGEDRSVDRLRRDSRSALHRGIADARGVCDLRPAGDLRRRGRLLGVGQRRHVPCHRRVQHHGLAGRQQRASRRAERDARVHDHGELHRGADLDRGGAAGGWHDCDGDVHAGGRGVDRVDERPLVDGDAGRCGRGHCCGVGVDGEPRYRRAHRHGDDRRARRDRHAGRMCRECDAHQPRRRCGRRDRDDRSERRPRVRVDGGERSAVARGVAGERHRAGIGHLSDNGACRRVGSHRHPHDRRADGARHAAGNHADDAGRARCAERSRRERGRSSGDDRVAAAGDRRCADRLQHRDRHRARLRQSRQRRDVARDVVRERQRAGRPLLLARAREERRWRGSGVERGRGDRGIGRASRAAGTDTAGPWSDTTGSARATVDARGADAPDRHDRGRRAHAHVERGHGRRRGDRPRDRGGHGARPGRHRHGAGRSKPDVAVRRRSARPLLLPRARHQRRLRESAVQRTGTDLRPRGQPAAADRPLRRIDGDPELARAGGYDGARLRARSRDRAGPDQSLRGAAAGGANQLRARPGPGRDPVLRARSRADASRTGSAVERSRGAEMRRRSDRDPDYADKGHPQITQITQIAQIKTCERPAGGPPSGPPEGSDTGRMNTITATREDHVFIRPVSLPSARLRRAAGRGVSICQSLVLKTRRPEVQKQRPAALRRLEVVDHLRVFDRTK